MKKTHVTQLLFLSLINKNKRPYALEMVDKVHRLAVGMGIYGVSEVGT